MPTYPVRKSISKQAKRQHVITWYGLVPTVLHTLLALSHRAALKGFSPIKTLLPNVLENRSLPAGTPYLSLHVST